MDDESVKRNENVSGDQLMQDNEARFFLASVLGSLQDSVVTINLKGVITSWNKGAEHIYGYPASEAIGQSLELVLFPDDFTQLFVNINRIRSGDQMELYDTFRIHKGGRHLHIEVTLSPVKNDEGAVIGVSTVARDVSELRKTQAALRLSESRLRGVLEAAVDFGVIVLDSKGIIVDWNRGAENIFGYKKEEAIGRSASIIFTPEDRDASVPVKEMEIAKTKGRSLDERWHLRKDGTRFFMSGVMTPLVTKDLHGFVKIARNITERKLAEEALIISEQRKSLAIKSAEMGEWEWELSTDQVTISEQAILLLGLRSEVSQVSTSFLMELVVPADQQAVMEGISNANTGLNILQIECRIRRVDSGDIKWVHVYGRVVAHESETPSKMIGVVYDITPRKLLEQQKDDFISLASHELKTPITAIKTYSELLHELLEDRLSRSELSVIERLNSQVNRLTALVQNLLDTSILSQGGFKLNVQPVNLNEMIEANMEPLKDISSHHTIIWLPGNPASVHADEQRIMQVLTNFIGNAAKYSPAGTEIILSTHDDQERATVRVKDHGPGILPEAQSRLFERYYRGINTPGHKGFGLGLYICAQIIRQHNGIIGVESPGGEGSTFYFALPYT